MPKYLVTGSRGFVGRNLTTTLKDLGHDLLRFDLIDYESVETLWDEVSHVLNVEHIDCIFHVGALTDTLARDGNQIFMLNADFTEQLSSRARQLGIPLVYSSSAASYGTDGNRPSNLYGWSKYLGEAVVRANGQVALRYFNVFGPGESHKRAMASFLFQAWKQNRDEQNVEIFPGEPKRDFVHVDDVVAANLAAMRGYFDITGNFFDVGMGQATSFETMLDWANIPYSYSTKEDIPAGYQFYTRANREKFVPSWDLIVDLEERVRSYLGYLDGRAQESKRR